MTLIPPMRTLSAVEGLLRPEDASRMAAKALQEAGNGQGDPTSSLAFDADFSRSWAAFGGVAALKRLHALHPARPAMKPQQPPSH